MRRLILTAAFAALAALAPSGPARAGVADELGLSEAEASSCRSQVAVLENRQRIFAKQRLAPDEARRRNAEPLAALAECRRRYQLSRRAEDEERAVREEVARRLPDGGSEAARERLERQVRIERARAKPRSALGPDERRLVEEEVAREAAVRGAAERARDPAFRRAALSAIVCAHERQLATAQRERDGEPPAGALGDRDRRMRGYFLRNEIRRLEANLASEREHVAAAGGRLPCSEPRVARLARCAALPGSAQEAEPGCAGDDVQEYLKAVR